LQEALNNNKIIFQYLLKVPWGCHRQNLATQIFLFCQ